MKEELKEYLIRLERIHRSHPEFNREAYRFILNALERTVKSLDNPRHITGQELSFGIRDFAIEEFGALAGTVLKYWGLNSTHDFGKVVFFLIEARLLGKTDEDTIDDFKDVYDFDEAFFDIKVDYDI